MKRIFILLLCCPLLTSGQTAIDYKILYSDHMEKTGLEVQVSMALKKPADSTCFSYPDEVWGESHLSRCLTGLESKQPGYRFKIVPDSNRLVVYHPHQKNISFSYKIKQDYPGDSIRIFNRPRVKDNYFHVQGQSLFVIPEQVVYHKTGQPYISAGFEWVGFPAGYTIHNTLGANQQKKRKTLLVWDELYSSLFVGGDYRIYSFRYEGKPVDLAVRGEWQLYKEEQLFAEVKRVISVQRAFWKDNSAGYFTVIMSPTVTAYDSTFSGQSICGTALYNGFMIQASNNPFNDFGSIKYTLNHELMHNWIGQKIRPQNEELNYWFSEGFTDYYTYKNRLRSGDLTMDQWQKEFNEEVIKAHFKNPQRNKPNYVVKDNFWKGRDYEKIPYRRGAIFALWLDNQILKVSGYTQSLDDAMKDILKECTQEHKTFTNEMLLRVARRYLQRDIAYFFEKYVISGVDYDFKTEDLIDGFAVDYREDGMMLLSASSSARNRYLNIK